MLIIFHVISPLAAYSDFHRQNKTKIPLADSQTLQQEWLASQPQMKRYDIPVLSKESIPEILKYFNIETSPYGLDNPSYNPYGRDFFYFELKDPSSGLLGVYLKPRNNPFCIRYPQGDKESTLVDLLKYEIAIEEAFVFWDDHQQPPTAEINQELIVLNLFADESKEDAINDYLIENQIINKPLLVKLGCYNATPNTGLVCPLPGGEFEGMEIAAIYFDNGMRILLEDEKTSGFKKGIAWREEIKQKYQTELNQTENERMKTLLQENIKKLTEAINNLHQEIIKTQTYTLAGLLKLANGAKNIYLFSFNIQKRIKEIELPDADDPYQVIRDWKRENNLYTFPPLIKQSNYYYEGYTLKHVCETANHIYHITCQYDYPKRLQQWKNQAILKPGNYLGYDLRNLLGKESKKLYKEDGSYLWYNFSKGFLDDRFYIDGMKVECEDFFFRIYKHYITETLSLIPPPLKRKIN
ncbi:MAG: hypothetical protein Q8894_02140 [Sweet potato little leaf phytoplasma]|nr:hypothetical protein [Pigeon pea little leaf phytoplasma]MDV3196607.1 hypothetical protein [Pigeon pea little leaf phytoplasma]MDV3204565.1 hypothetical protein [Sweet potato little leaf phytoplasma]